MSEMWRPVRGFEGYYDVSDEGRIRSIDRVVPHARSGLLHLTGRVLKPAATGGAHGGQQYLAVNLARNGRHQMVRVHRAVAEAFVLGRRVGLEVRHMNGDASDNRAVNLKWGTKSENAQDTLRHGHHPGALQTHCKHGHSLAPENVYLTRDGHRECRACVRIRVREYRARKRAA